MMTMKLATRVYVCRLYLSSEFSCGAYTSALISVIHVRAPPLYLLGENITELKDKPPATAAAAAS